MNDISAGDLVMVVKHHCRDARSLGEVFAVSAIVLTRFYCARCKFVFPETWCAEDDADDTTTPLSWLRRIPPLAELNEAERKQSEPA